MPLDNQSVVEGTSTFLTKDPYAPLREVSARVLPAEVDEAIDEVEASVLVEGRFVITVDIHKRISPAKLIGWITVLGSVGVAVSRYLQ